MEKIPLTKNFSCDINDILGCVSISKKFINQITKGLQEGSLCLAPYFTYDNVNKNYKLIGMSIVASQKAEKQI